MGNNQEEKSKILNKTMTIIGIIFSIIFMSIFLCWGSLNVAKFFIYQDFYNLSKDVASIPGIKDGFVASGITYLNSDNTYALVGSMNKNDKTYLYVVDSSNEMRSYELLSNGENIKVSSNMDIAFSNNTIYLVNEKSVDNELTYGIYTISIDELEKKDSSDKPITYIDIKSRVSTSINNCSYIFADSNFVYIGSTSYEDNINGNIVKYSVFDSDFSVPLDIYSTSSFVKGASFINEENIVLISNEGFEDTYIGIFNLSEIRLTSTLINEINVKEFNDPIKVIKGPMLLNGLDLNSSKDKLLIISTSGSSKYIFGSMFFSNKIRELTIS